MFVPVSDLVILERIVLRQHPKTGTHHPNIIFLLRKKWKLSFFSDECFSLGSDDVSSSVGHVFWGGLDGDLKPIMFLSDVKEGSLAVFPYWRNAATYSLDILSWLVASLIFGVFVDEVLDGYGGLDGLVCYITLPLLKFDKVASLCW